MAERDREKEKETQTQTKRKHKKINIQKMATFKEIQVNIETDRNVGLTIS